MTTSNTDTQTRVRCTSNDQCHLLLMDRHRATIGGQGRRSRLHEEGNRDLSGPNHHQLRLTSLP